MGQGRPVIRVDWRFDPFELVRQTPKVARQTPKGRALIEPAALGGEGGLVPGPGAVRRDHGRPSAPRARCAAASHRKTRACERACSSSPGPGVLVSSRASSCLYLSVSQQLQQRCVPDFAALPWDGSCIFQAGRNDKKCKKCEILHKNQRLSPPIM